jgi:predicted Fe-Mo cluster-binding NifX family protein
LSGAEIKFPEFLAWHLICITGSMNVAIAVFKESVSPRLDIADRLMCFQLSDGNVHNKRFLPLVDVQHDRLIALLRKQGVSTLICGGCPKLLYSMLSTQGIRVVPVVEGLPGQVIKSLQEDNLDRISICNPGRRCKENNLSKCKCKQSICSASSHGITAVCK